MSLDNECSCEHFFIFGKLVVAVIKPCYGCYIFTCILRDTCNFLAVSSADLNDSCYFICIVYKAFRIDSYGRSMSFTIIRIYFLSIPDECCFLCFYSKCSVSCFHYIVCQLDLFCQGKDDIILTCFGIFVTIDLKCVVIFYVCKYLICSIVCAKAYIAYTAVFYRRLRLAISDRHSIC